MKLKNLFFTPLGALAMSFFVASCNDDFSEEDLLRMQVDLANEQDSLRAAQALDALNQAGEFFSLSMTVVNDDNFVEGASVTMHGQESGNVTLTTDADGTVTFTGVTSGGNIVTISADGYAGAILNVDFPELEEGTNYEVTDDGVYVPIKANTSAIVPLYAFDGSAGSVGTIKGRVEIETDLTNTTPEVPQDITLVATVNVNSSQFDTAGGVSIDTYAFDGSNNTGIGSGVVDNATGEYSITVPSSASGIGITLEVPNIETTQRMAVGFENGLALARPEYRDVLTNFGPAFQNADSIPNINGAIAIFPEPPAAGTGFTLSNFQRVPDTLHTVSLDMRSDDITRPIDQGELVLQVTSLGSGYTSSPSITITDATGTNGRAEAHVEFAVGGVTLTTAGVGYIPGESVSMDLIATRREVSGSLPDTTVVFEDQSIVTLFVNADDDGNLTQDSINVVIDEAIANGDLGFDTEHLVHVTGLGFIDHVEDDEDGDELEGLRVEFGSVATTDPVGTVDVSVSRVYAIHVESEGTGDNYTNPTFSFSGGGGTSQAAINVISYASRWTFDLDNSGASGYEVLPEDVYFEYFGASTAPGVSRTDLANVDEVEEFLNGVSNGPADFIIDGILSVNGSGGLAYTDQLATYVTSFYAVQAPSIRVVERVAEIAHDQVTINNEGIVTGLFDLNVHGVGYVNELEVTIEPSATDAPGSGASVDLVGGFFGVEGEFFWGGSSNVLNGGFGYLQDLNLQNTVGEDEDFSYVTTGSESVLVRSGDVIVVNINYGTGVRQIDVDGDWDHTNH